jgi:hypothetical protein
MEDVNEKLEAVETKLGDEHPTTLKLKFARGLPFSRPFKRLGADTSRVQLDDPDEEVVDNTLARITANQEVNAEKIGFELYSRVVRGQGDFLVTAGRRDEAIQLATRTEDFYNERRLQGRLSADVVQDITEFKDALE